MIWPTSQTYGPAVYPMGLHAGGVMRTRVLHACRGNNMVGYRTSRCGIAISGGYDAVAVARATEGRSPRLCKRCVRVTA